MGPTWQQQGAAEMCAVHLVVADQLMFILNKTKRGSWQRAPQKVVKDLQIESKA